MLEGGLPGAEPGSALSWLWVRERRWGGSGSPARRWLQQALVLLKPSGPQPRLPRLPEVLDVRMETLSLGFITVPGEWGLSPGEEKPRGANRACPGHERARLAARCSPADFLAPTLS